jgi:hypothetical protein
MKSNYAYKSYWSYSYFAVAVELEWSRHPESFACSIVATGRASNAGQVKGDDPDQKGYPGLPRWGFGLGLTTSPRKNIIAMQPQRRGHIPPSDVVSVEVGAELQIPEPSNVSHIHLHIHFIKPFKIRISYTDACVLLYTALFITAVDKRQSYLSNPGRGFSERLRNTALVSIVPGLWAWKCRVFLLPGNRNCVLVREIKPPLKSKVPGTC